MLLWIERYIRTQFGGFHGQFRVFIQKESVLPPALHPRSRIYGPPGLFSLEGNGGAFACRLVDLAIRALMATLMILCGRFIMDILIIFSALFI